MKLLELSILLVAIILVAAIPQLLLASTINADEFQKIGGSSALATIVVAAYKAWKK